MILAGDVGGTNTRLAWCHVSGSKAELKLVRSFKSGEHASLRDIVKGFVEESGHEAERACFGVAGPVRDGRAFRSFAAKGRMSSLLERIPVRAILNDRCALLGAARLATLAPGSC